MSSELKQRFTVQEKKLVEQYVGTFGNNGNIYLGQGLSGWAPRALWADRMTPREFVAVSCRYHVGVGVKQRVITFFE